MVESVQVFNYGENTPVRVRVMNGQTWFVAKDVCKVLGISNHKDAVSRLDDDERWGVGITDPLGGTQRMSAVSESGLYHLVFQSRKPEARRFRRWVTMEVLPEIRRTGSFNIGAAPGADRAAGCGRSALGRLPIPRERSAELGEFYSELRKWVLKEDEAAVAELAGVSPGHVAEVLAGRKPGYGVLCLLVEYATENRAAGRMRVVRSAARRAEQVEELRLDFMTASRGSEWHVGIQPTCDKLTGSVGCERGAMGASAAGSPCCERAQAAGSACPEVVLRPEGRRTAGSHETGHDVTDGIIDFNGMEG